MHRKLAALCATVLLLAACVPAAPLRPTATLLPWPTPDPRGTVVPLAGLDLAPLLVRPGDLPDWMSRGELEPHPAATPWFDGMPRPVNEIREQLVRNGSIDELDQRFYGDGWLTDGRTAGWVTVFLFESDAERDAFYHEATDMLAWPASDRAGPIRHTDDPLPEVGEMARIAMHPDMPFRNSVDIIFVRCHAFAIVAMIEPGRESRKNRNVEALAAEATAYAKRLDERLAATVCP